MSGANEYIRQVLHHAEPPPSIPARFFYTSPVPIDDPLSPLPPPTSGSVPPNQPPKPFSEYDNTALDKAWNALRRKILKYNEERGEKSTSQEGSSRARAASGSRRDGKRDGSRRDSGSREAAPRTRQGRSAASALNQVEAQDDQEEELTNMEAPHSAIEVATLPDTTGTPFIRAPSRKKISEASRRDETPNRPRIHTHDTYQWDDSSHLVEHSPTPETQETNYSSPTTTVAVGISRLHQVEMPELAMQPIYWVPVHDTAQVVRGTWFYQDNMMPVEPNVANMLEAGYVELQAWTETWKDELSSAIEVGAIGEMKIVHQLWPEKPSKPIDSRPTSRRGTVMEDSLLRTATANLVVAEPDTPEELRNKAVDAACDIIDISTGPGGADNKAAGVTTYGRQGPPRHYPSHGVIYANEREARILKPTLMPSAYYGRRPLANYIRKGTKLGIPVVRGFDQTAWDKLYPSKNSKKAEKAEQGVATSSSGAPPKVRRKTDPDLAKAERPQVSDLVLVIHGIGQKLSQRMESFHFTHAMNAFRRDVNVEVGTNEVKARFRKDMGSIMVLPVNWRQSLSFENGGYNEGLDDAAASGFTLNDITVPTLPSVRNIVSDVMLDIPYYMSHHQASMIGAVTAEANRVYQLWCRNNPGFAEHGRVHIIAHSLGSVMAIDILSRQPTTIPAHLSDPTTIDLTANPLDHLLFPTTNLFLAGSPAGFFLLLQRAGLLPRLDHPSYPADPATSSNTSICGSQGQYGCLAVANIYNIVNGYDPVACLMNATVDAPYAASLKPAHIPSASSTWFGGGTNSSSNQASWFAGSGSNSGPTPPTLPRLPSNVELETHDFTREEIAEKRMFLLNDNGQIDYFLRYGGGVLDIQYLNMLSAHSSYWLLKDFTRFVVSEIGRAPGRQGTLFGVRAVKKKKALV